MLMIKRWAHSPGTRCQLNLHSEDRCYGEEYIFRDPEDFLLEEKN